MRFKHGGPLSQHRTPAFSHAAEKELLPEGRNHEALTANLIRSDEMRPIWEGIKIDSEDVVKLALGRKELPDVGFTPWETILTEIIVGDAFGVDRMDYLLRDSHHAGVAYGRFDQYRLIDTLHILPQVSTDVRRMPGSALPWVSTKAVSNPPRR